jgi:hypothetical protein
LLASGTLAPLASFALELRLPFPHRLENPHVIDPSKQVFACVLGRGVSGRALNSSYGQRDSGTYKVQARGREIRLGCVASWVWSILSFVCSALHRKLAFP